ncbi:MAG: hypothetical protein VXZ72_00835 [Chlamydiota bacterium]|nr:hypothetical protein [Chlamydiota bacterium]
MAFLLGSSSGASFGSSSLSLIEQSYSPVFAETVDVAYLYNLLPSFYRNFMSDREVFSSVWNGMIPAISAETLNLWHINNAKSLVDIPIYTQRKWVKLPLDETEDFDVDPSLSLLGIAGLFSANDSLDRLDCFWRNRGGVDSATKSLRGTFTQDCSVSWSFEFNLSSISTYGALLVGYFNSESTLSLSDSLVAGVIGTSSTEAELFILHAASSSALTFRRSSFKLSASKDYRISCTYSARSNEVVATLVEISYTKVSSTGTTGEVTNSNIYTNELTDSAVDFVASGVAAGDTLTYDGKSYGVLRLEGTTKVYTDLDLLPAEASIPYTIVGEKEMTSVSMNIRSSAGDYKFDVDSFGTATIDTRNARDFLVPKSSSETTSEYEARLPSAYAAAEAAFVEGFTTNWRYTDPTSTYSIVYLPRIQSSYLNPSSVLYEHTDYSIDDKLIKFQEPPTSAMYAEYVAYDEKKLYNNFGSLVNIGEGEVSSDYLRSKIRAIFYAYFRGPTLKSIRTGVQIHLGLPISEEAGTVEAVNLAYSGKFGQIVISGKSYLFPLSVGTTLTVGDSVEQFQVLCEGVKILDYVNSPTWFDTFDEEPYEIQKFHTFLVELNLDAFDVADLPDAAVFVATISPTWKRSIFLAFKEVEDSLDILDSFVVDPTLNIYDSFSEEADAAYSSRFFDATPDSPIDPRAGAASDYVYGSYWVSDWVEGESTSATPISGLLGEVIISDNLGNTVTHVFGAGVANLQGLIDTLASQAWANSFIERRLNEFSTPVYRIHIYSPGSLGASHRITIDDSDINFPSAWSTFGWDDWSIDPSGEGEERYRGASTLSLDYDWTFDAGMADWDKPPLSIARTAEQNTRRLLWRDTASESRFITGKGLVYEGHNRPVSTTAQVEYSGDSTGVRSRVEGGDLVAEAGILLVSETAAGTMDDEVSVPSGSSATQALSLQVPGADFSSSSSSSYLGPVTSAGGITDEPIWPVYVSFKFSDPDDWGSDGVSGSGYIYSTMKVIQRASSDTLILDSTPPIHSPTVGSDNVYIEVRRGGPLGTVIGNGTLSNADGRTNTAGVFWVQSGGSPDITDWGGSGQPLEGLTTSVDSYHSTNINVLTEDEVYIAIRSTSSSSFEYASEYSYSDWYIAKVKGYGAGGDEEYLHFDDDDTGDSTSSATDLEWVIWKEPTTRLSLHQLNHGTSAVPTADSNFVTLGSPTSIASYTGFVLTRSSATPTYDVLRLLSLSDSEDFIDSGVLEGDLIKITCSDSDVSGTYAIGGVDAIQVGSDIWPVIHLEKSETGIPDSSFSGTTYFDSAATVEFFYRPNRRIFVQFDQQYKLLAGGEEHTLSGKGGRVSASSPYTNGVQVDHVFSSDADLGDWEIVGFNPRHSATVVFLHTEEYLSFASRIEFGETVGLPPGYAYTNENYSYKAAIVDNEYYKSYFDYYLEVSPDEDVNVDAIASPFAGNLTTVVGAATEVGHGYEEIVYSGSYKYRGAFGPVLLGRLRASGTDGGAPASGPLVQTLSSGSSPADDLVIFEDLNASFLSIPATSGVPDNLSYLLLTYRKSDGESLADWLPGLLPSSSSLSEGEANARYAIVQVKEILSNRQLLVRVHETGEGVTNLASHWKGLTAAGYHWEIRDLSAGDPDRALIYESGIVVQADSFSAPIYFADQTQHPSFAIPGGNGSGLPLRSDWTQTSDSLSPSTHKSLLDSLRSEDTSKTIMVEANSKKVAICLNVFRATLSNGSTAVYISGKQADLNELVHNGGTPLTELYVQAAPTIPTTTSETDPGVMLADGPVFKVNAVAPVKASGHLQLVGVPGGSVDVTVDSTTVTVSGTGSVDATRDRIITALASHPTCDVSSGGSGKVSVVAKEPGPDGNSIALSTSAPAFISVTAMSGGSDAILTADSAYSGVDATDTLVMVRGTSSPFPINIGSETITDWYSQSSGDLVTIQISEKVPTE